jgi:predicted MFS family arabinose efflux permease
MRTDEECIRLIHSRTAEIRRERQKKRQGWYRAVSLAACLFAVVLVGMRIPGCLPDMTGDTVSQVSGAASLIGTSDALGYILMGLFSFCLGVSVTVLLYRLRRREERRKQEEGNDEL